MVIAFSQPYELCLQSLDCCNISNFSKFTRYCGYWRACVLLSPHRRTASPSASCWTFVCLCCLTSHFVYCCDNNTCNTDQEVAFPWKTSHWKGRLWLSWWRLAQYFFSRHSSWPWVSPVQDIWHVFKETRVHAFVGKLWGWKAHIFWSVHWVVMKEDSFGSTFWQFWWEASILYDDLSNLGFVSSKFCMCKW